MSNKRKWLLYAAYTIAVGIFFAYILFPSDVFKNYARFYLHRVDPDLSVSIERISPAFPIGLAAHNLAVDLRQTRLIEPDRIRITLKAGSIFRSDRTFAIQANAHEGRIEAALSTANEATGRRADFNGTITGIDLGHIPALKEKGIHEVYGPDTPMSVIINGVGSVG